MSENPWKIPASWKWSEIKGLGDIVSGGTPSTKEASYWGNDVNWISPSDLTGYSQKTIARGAKNLTLKGLQNSSAKVMPAGSIHFSSRAPIGYVVISSEPISTNQGFKSLVPAEGIFSEYAFYYLKASKQMAEKYATGTTFKEISGTAFGKLPFPVPPTNEQKRIVAKIEELFSELDKGIESLKLAREQLKVYRQAVLKHAFEGKLTTDWREQNKDNLEPSDQLLARIKREREVESSRQKKKGLKKLRPMSNEDFSWLSQLPSEWHWERLGWMTCGIEYGTSAKSSKSGDVPVLRMGNIQNMKFDWSDLVYTSDPREISNYSLQDGDVLFNRTNSPEWVGKTAIYKGEQPAIFAGYLIRVNQIDHIVDARFLNFYLNSHTAKQYGNMVKTDGVNQSNINGDKLAHYPFPYCSLEEQHVVVDRLEEQMSSIDRNEADINFQLQKTEALRQSILKKAFSGQLVPQDASDEPASVLLERIKAEKASRSGQKKANAKRSAA